MSSAIIDLEGNIWVRGNNGNGQLGLGDFKYRETFTKIDYVNQKFKKVSMSKYETFMVALDVDQHLWFCGNKQIESDNIDDITISYGMMWRDPLNRRNLGNISTPPKYMKQNTLEKIEIQIKFIDVSCGHDFFIAIDEDYHIWSYGDNKHGQLAIADDLNYLYDLTKINSSQQFQKISCGIDNVIAIDLDNEMWGCGSNEGHKLGINSNIQKFNHFVPINYKIKANIVKCSLYHTIIIDTFGNLWGCGNNTNQALGLPIPNAKEFTKIDLPTSFIDIAVGSGGTLALDIDGNIWSVGVNFKNNLGITAYTKKFIPLDIGTNFVSLSIGENTSFALDIEHNLWVSGKWYLDNENVTMQKFTKVLDYIGSLMNTDPINKYNIKSARRRDY